MINSSPWWSYSLLSLLARVAPFLARWQSPTGGGAFGVHYNRPNEAPQLIRHRRYALRLARAPPGGIQRSLPFPSESVKATAKGNFPLGAPWVKVPSPQNFPLTTPSKRVTLPPLVST